MNVRRVIALALLALTGLLLFVVERGGSGDTSEPASAKPSAPYTGTACDGPSPEWTMRGCGWWRQPHSRTVVDGDARSKITLWKPHRGPLASMPPRAHPLAGAALADVWAADPPDLPSVPTSAHWIFRYPLVAGVLLVLFLVGVRLLIVPPWKSRASRET